MNMHMLDCAGTIGVKGTNTHKHTMKTQLNNIETHMKNTVFGALKKRKQDNL